jgi:hypothetical protein
MSDTHQILSALIDREPVDPDSLAVVLEEPEARKLLVDFLRLRVLVSADSQPEGDVAPGASTSVRGRVRDRNWHRLLDARWARAGAAVLLVSAGVAAGVLLGGDSASPGPPPPSNVIRLQRGTDWQPLEPQPATTLRQR